MKFDLLCLGIFQYRTKRMSQVLCCLFCTDLSYSLCMFHQLHQNTFLPHMLDIWYFPQWTSIQSHKSHRKHFGLFELKTNWQHIACRWCGLADRCTHLEGMENKTVCLNLVAPTPMDSLGRPCRRSKRWSMFQLNNARKLLCQEMTTTISQEMYRDDNKNYVLCCLRNLQER